MQNRTFGPKLASIDRILISGLISAAGRRMHAPGTTPRITITPRHDAVPVPTVAIAPSITPGISNTPSFAVASGIERRSANVNGGFVSPVAGVSVSALQRSVVQVDPMDLKEAAELREWYDAVGRGADTTAAGEGLANSGRSA
jgi:hypothetical protein